MENNISNLFYYNIDDVTQTSSIYNILYPLCDLTKDELNAFQVESSDNNSIIKPYIKVKNLNKNPDDDIHQECIKPKSAIEIGLMFEF